MLPPVRTIAGNQPKGRVLGGTLPTLAPARVMAQDATAPDNLYRTNPSSPAAKSNDRGSFTGGAVRLLRKALPINAAMFAQDLTGNKVPLTEQDLTQDELSVLRKAAEGNSSIQYESYGPSSQTTPGERQNLASMLSTPTERLVTTIGRANIERRLNGTHVLDAYDFNNVSPQREFSRGQFTAAPNAYSKLRYVAGILGSGEGQGIPVDINLDNLKRPLPGEFPAPRVLKGALPPKK